MHYHSYHEYCALWEFFKCQSTIHNLILENEYQAYLPFKLVLAFIYLLIYLFVVKSYM